ncbi:hypothetical protein [Planctopirus limnophila]|nr:hypothetical protein [Planctopirus limnophila]
MALWIAIVTQENMHWLQEGQGRLPVCLWSFTTDAPLADLKLARETGEVVASDHSGGIYLIDIEGRVRALTRLGQVAREVGFADNGATIAAVSGPSSLSLMNRKLSFQWTRQLPDSILATALAPYGEHVAVSLTDGMNAIYTLGNKKQATFQTPRPLKHLAFLGTEAALIGAAEYGLISKIRLDGQILWSESLWSTVGGLAVTGNGESILLAGYMHGLQMFGNDGSSAGTLMLDGTASHVGQSFHQHRIYSATLEQHLACLSKAGDLVYLLGLPEPLHRLQVTAMGDAVIVGFPSGRIMKLAML